MNKVLKVILIAVATVIISAVAFLLFSSWSVNSHPVPQHKISKVYIGMPSAEVRTLLGKPYRTHSKTNGDFSWTYGSKWQWYFFTLNFSATSNVVEFYEDD